jgi:hypothetical protein
LSAAVAPRILTTVELTSVTPNRRWTVREGLIRLPAVALAWVLAVGCATVARAQSFDVVEKWNRVMREAVVTPGANPSTVFVHRPMAIVSVAIFDAANTFDRVYLPAVTFADTTPVASADAAISQAAHDTLAALLPSLRERFATELTASLASIPPDAAREGSRVGAAIARAVLESRADDGWSRTPPAYTLPNLPGYWRPTPPADQAATFTHYPDVAGFFVASGRRFLMEAPQPLSSSRYAADFDEVKSVGAVNSTARTADQTKMARLWHGVGTTTTSPNLWNGVLIDVARARGWSGLDLARGLALMNMTQHDAILTSFTGKFLYGFWRPVTAIREAASDNNPATEPDATWTPLLNTPSYPGHPGNRACLSASQAQLLQRLFGQDDIPVQVTWLVSNGPSETRRYNGFQQLADEEAKSRIWGGIHFEFESLAARGSCSQLADYGADNVLRKR